MTPAGCSESPPPESLLGVRIGPVGRRVLGRAAPPGATDAQMWIPPERYQGTVARRLRRLGLVETRRVRRHAYGARGPTRPTGIALTRLGAVVTAVLTERVRDGQRVRWPRLMPEIVARLAVEASPTTGALP